MTDGDDLRRKPPHIALFPSAGMGHLTPFLRLAAMLASRGCTITLITANPTVSAAESTHISAFFSAHPRINRLEFETIPYSPTNPTTDDPFFLQFEAINRSVHFLRPLLSSLSPPLSAVVSDFAVAASFGPIANDLSIPTYVVWTSSARFLSLMTYLSLSISENSPKFGDENVEIPGLSPIPVSCIPPPVFNPNHLFALILLSNARFFPKAKGLLLNTFERFESETINALNNGRVLSCLPPVHPIGPLEPSELEKGPRLPWLDDQSVGSVVYISFGSRTAMSKDQIRELGNGLEISGCAFLWVLKTRKVDTDDNEELQEVLEESFIERTTNRGIVVKEWVKQEEILAHPAIGGFVSHCGWNSVTEAARHGVPVLAWPQHGDQRVNAEVVERAGLGVWVREWGWGGERLVRGEEIGEKVSEMMSDRELRNRAREVGEEARKAWEVNGSSEKALMGVIDGLKP
ncbi:UDP-glycosyltransferase 708G1-like [Actinidia eriantha]|uniref:UDP-glycosyltransferase 708G1-like n=1 Tax=Actinidia eriantha TaxID=165200 RepID=UPI00258930FF|nr:UDP-glycosyltransferase 708G1-like [Actinidia eriantha]